MWHEAVLFSLIVVHTQGWGKALAFAQMLEETIRRYQSRTVEAAQIITELIDMAKEMCEADQRGEALGLSEDELAFYDALRQ
jgi:type I restriction enzyme R subunit